MPVTSSTLNKTNLNSELQIREQRLEKLTEKSSEALQKLLDEHTFKSCNISWDNNFKGVLVYNSELKKGVLIHIRYAQFIEDTTLTNIIYIKKQSPRGLAYDEKTKLQTALSELEIPKLVINDILSMISFALDKRKNLNVYVNILNNKTKEL